MSEQQDEPILPRLLASNALRANLGKHMTLNQMADNKASMIMTAASLIAIFIIPVSFYLVERLSRRSGGGAAAGTTPGGAVPEAGSPTGGKH